jgi:hypothetical protein
MSSQMVETTLEAAEKWDAACVIEPVRVAATMATTAAPAARVLAVQAGSLRCDFMAGSY